MTRLAACRTWPLGGLHRPCRPGCSASFLNRPPVCPAKLPKNRPRHGRESHPRPKPDRLLESGSLSDLAALLLVLAWCLPAGAAPDLFGSLDWEPDVQVLTTSRFVPVDSADALPRQLQVFTCLLATEDLQLRRCDPPAFVADSLAAPCYRGEYEISIEIFSGRKRHRRSVEARYERFEFFRESTQADPGDGQRWHHFELELPKGEYGWWVEFQDLNSRRVKRMDGSLVVAGLEGRDWALSGLWLLADVDSLAPDPLHSRPFAEEKGGAHPPELTVYYEVWSARPVDLRLGTRILDRRERSRHERDQLRHYAGGLSRNLLQVPLGELGSGDYLVDLELGEEGAGLRRKDRRKPWVDRAGISRRSLPFSVRWRGEPGSPGDLAMAVEQLRYILPRKRFKEMQEAPPGHRQRLFEEFWSTVDPSPETELNELMEEYYRRAEFADRQFSWSRFAGWRSDRGRVYMIHGDPDEVEREAGDLDRPAWERWIYRESGQSFLFVDRQGFGDYQLVIDPR
jgi:GWxTD domain-containing protein